MKNSKMVWTLLFVLALVVTACGGAEGGTQPTGPEGSEAQEAGVEAGGPQTTEADLSLATVTGGLEQATAYKSRLEVRFSGNDESGLAIDNSWIVVEETRVDPPARRLSYTSSESTGGQPSEVSLVEVITIGEVEYMVSVDAAGTRSCIPQKAGDFVPMDQVEGPDMWGAIDGARYAGTEEVNGVSAKHYTWQESALTGKGFSAGKGETWVAVDGGYVVRQKVEVTGKGLTMGEGEGTTTWQWDVTDLDGTFEIVPPEGCENATGDLPVIADAEDISIQGDYLTYASPSAFEEVVAFCQAEMPSAGWQPSGTPTEKQGLWMQDWSKDGGTVSIAISWDVAAKKTLVILDATKR